MIKPKKIFLTLGLLFFGAFLLNSEQAKAFYCENAEGACQYEAGTRCPAGFSAVGGYNAQRECQLRHGAGGGGWHCCKADAPVDHCTGGDCSLTECTTARPLIVGGSCGDPAKSCCSLAPTGDYCTGGDCSLSECPVDRPLIVGGSCSDSTKSCCSFTAPRTPAPPPATTPIPTASGAMWSVEELGGYGLPSGKITGIIEAVVSWLLYIFGFLGIIAFVISGIMYLTAAGDTEQEKKAKGAMRMGIIGIVVGLVGLIIINVIDSILNARMSF